MLISMIFRMRAGRVDITTTRSASCTDSSMSCVTKRMVLRSARQMRRDRKSTRLNSSHANISYAVFCLKKKKHDLHDREHVFARRLAGLHSICDNVLGKTVPARPQVSRCEIG